MESSTKVPISVWALKPWWCQPWSIVMTGSGLIGGSWVLGHRFWVTGLVTVPVLLWMVYFLWVYPQLFRQLQTRPPAMDAHVAAAESDRQS